MAITKIGRIRGHISHIINYAENADKTVLDEATFNGLHNAIKYAENEDKTEKMYYVSGINVMPETAAEEMIITKKQFGKTDGIAAYHVIQSFKAGEVTPELCHQIGKELVGRLWSGRFQAIVATHLNTDCAHNHIVINSVSFADGKRFLNNKALYKLIQKTSDEICIEHGLSVIEQPGKIGHIPYNLYMANRHGKPTLWNTVRADIDETLKHSYTYKDFILNLKKQGYVVNEGKYLSLRPQGFEKSVRTYKLGDIYSEQSIRERIILQRNSGGYVHLSSPTPDTHKTYKVKGNLKNARKIKGFRALCIKYMYLLGKLPKNRKHTPKHPLMKIELIRFDEYKRRFKLMLDNKIDTVEQLNSFINVTEDKLNALVAQRNHIYNQLRRCTDSAKIEVLKQKRTSLTGQITPLRADLKTAKGIEAFTEQMKKNISIVNQHYFENQKKLQKTKRHYYER